MQSIYSPPRTQRGHYVEAQLQKLTRERLTRYGQTLSFHLEPQRERSPGGLRDYQPRPWFRGGPNHLLGTENDSAHHASKNEIVPIQWNSERAPAATRGEVYLHHIPATEERQTLSPTTFRQRVNPALLWRDCPVLPWNASPKNAGGMDGVSSCPPCPNSQSPNLCGEVRAKSADSQGGVCAKEP